MKNKNTKILTSPNHQFLTLQAFLFFIFAGSVLYIFLKPYSYIWLDLLLIFIYSTIFTVANIIIFQSKNNILRLQQQLITAKKNAREANNAQANFLSSINHELRTPLNGILGLSSLMKSTSLDQQQEKYVTLIHSSGELLLELINDILDFVKMDMGNLSLKISDFSLNEFIDDIRLHWTKKLQEKNLEIKVKIDQDVPHFINSDKDRLNLILQHLLSNAYKFTFEGSITLHITAEKIITDQYLISFHIIDTGIGIKSENIAKLFTKFEKTDKAKESRFPGSGLGLAICKKLVHIFEGTIHVNTVYNEGSDFWFSIPCQTAPKKEKKACTIKEVREIDHFHILVVDDNRINQMIVSEMLKTIPIVQTTSVLSGAEALKAIETTDFDLIFMDHIMPDMDGLTVVKKIRTLKGKASLIPIVTLSGSDIDTTPENLKKLSINGHVGKPIKTEVLLNLVNQFIEKSAEASTEPAIVEN